MMEGKGNDIFKMKKDGWEKEGKIKAAQIYQSIDTCYDRTMIGTAWWKYLGQH